MQRLRTTIFKVVLVFVVALSLYALLSLFAPDVAKTDGKRAGQVMDRGNLQAEWKRFDIPITKSCDVITENDDTWVEVRPNGDELLAYTMDVSGVATFISTGEPVKGKINRRVRYILYRGQETNVGTPYVILCY